MRLSIPEVSLIKSLRRTLLALVVTAACFAGPAGEPANTHDAAALLHHDIRSTNLPPPYATPSKATVANIVSPPPDARLNLPPGFEIRTFASNGFTNPRFMTQAPNGDIFVADTAGSQVVILRDANGDGVPEERFVFADGLNEPFGIAFRDAYIYIGDTDAIIRYPYQAGQTRVTGHYDLITKVPTGGHSTRNILFGPDGKLYLAIGSHSNDATNELPERAAISVCDADGKNRRIFASGLRNPTGMAFRPGSSELFTTVNERDERGDNLPPDYMTSVHDHDFFGWPFAYSGPHPDPKNGKLRPDLVAKTRVPDVLIQAHSAALGLVFYDGSMFPPDYRGDAFVALHGSWNRAQVTGYKIVRIHFRNGKPLGSYDDFVTGWILDESTGRVWGRPVGLLTLKDGSLLISDDGAKKIWRVSYHKKE
jgi:glucose/arabinose dehydrogenase